MNAKSTLYKLFIIISLQLSPLIITFNSHATVSEGDEFLIVDCLLPGQIRKLGKKAVFQTARRAIKTSARDCEIRGGEYVAVDSSSYASALKVWLPLAKEGDPEAQTYVGEIYEKGLGLPPDYTTAAQWYQQAADKGYSSAQINLGNLYEKGLGVPKDPQKALYWYRIASGLSDDMAFVPTQELEGLKEEAEESKKEAESLRQQLNQTQLELDKTKQELEGRQSGVEIQKQKLAETKRELDTLREQAVTSTNDTELNSLRAQLQQRESELETQRNQIEKLENDSKTYKGQLSQLDQGGDDVEELKKQAAEKGQESESLRKQLTRAQEELNRKKSEADTQQQMIEQLRTKFDQRIQQVEVSAGNDQEIQSLREQLNKRQNESNAQDQELNDLRNQIAQLEEKAESQNKKIANLQTNTGSVDKGDLYIELIDPKIAQTRGIKTQIKTRSGAERTIVGKVIASYGVESFTVNGVDENVNDEGMFKFKKGVQASDVPVKLVAVDKKGNGSSLEFVLTPEGKTNQDIVDEGPGLNFGQYYALIIGNNDYMNSGWQDLTTPKGDALMVDKVLREKYGFKTKVLQNATYSEILKALSEYQKDLSGNDNLLIYYAGHGQLDEANNRGFWVPVDGDFDKPINWISNLIIADYLISIQARHILVIADSCYSGTLTRGALESSNMSKEALKTMLAKRTRTALTSGDIQPVLDAGGGNHSVFAKALFDALNSNSQLLAGQKLHSDVYDTVTLKVEQIPQYAPIRFAGHESGDFLFVPKP